MIELTKFFDKSQRWQPFGDLSAHEKVIVSCITFTFAFYAIGALYLVAPVVGWVLLANLIKQWVSKTETEKQIYRVSIKEEQTSWKPLRTHNELGDLRKKLNDYWPYLLALACRSNQYNPEGHSQMYTSCGNRKSRPVFSQIILY